MQTGSIAISGEYLGFVLQSDHDVTVLRDADGNMQVTLTDNVAEVINPHALAYLFFHKLFGDRVNDK